MFDLAQTESREDQARRLMRDGEQLAAALPRLVLEARRVASTVVHGLHGRRQQNLPVLPVFFHSFNQLQF